MTVRNAAASSSAAMRVFFVMLLSVLSFSVFSAIGANAVQNRFCFVDLKARAFQRTVKKPFRLRVAQMDALSAYPAGEVQAVFTFLGGNVLIEHIPCALADAALEKPVRLQIGKIAVHGAETDALLRQRVCDLPRGHLLVRVPGQIVQQLPALLRHIFRHSP